MATKKAKKTKKRATKTEARYFIEHVVTRRKDKSTRAHQCPRIPFPYTWITVSTSNPESRERRNVETGIGVIRPTPAQAAAAARELLGITKEEWSEMLEAYRKRSERVKKSLARRSKRRLRAKDKPLFKSTYLLINGKTMRVSVLGSGAAKALDEIKRGLGKR